MNVSPNRTQDQAGRTHHGRMNVIVTKRAHVREHGGSHAQEVLHFPAGRGVHPPLHKDGVRHQRPHAEPTVRRLVGKLRVRPLCSPVAAAAVARTEPPAGGDVRHGAAETEVRGGLGPGRARTRRGVPPVPAALV